MKNIIITGDSLSVSRYDYEEEMCFNPWDCHVGMPSWSFRLRNLFIASAEGFKYADELNIKNSVPAMGEGFHEYDAIFGEKCRTVTPENGEIRINASSDTGTLVLYLQARPNNYCRFNISIDGTLVKEQLETYGNSSFYRGCELITLELPCDSSKTEHEIVFSDFDYAETEPKVTIAGISKAPVYATLTGQGSRTSKFLLYHYNERIARFSPDLMVLIFGGNDFLLYTVEDYRKYLGELFDRVTKDFPGVKLLTMTIPPSAKVRDEVQGVKYTDDNDWNEGLDKYNAVMEEQTALHNGICIRTKDIFAGIDPKEWRFDNVHMKRLGNDMLYAEVLKTLKENGIDL